MTTGTTFTPLGPAPLDAGALPDYADAPRLAGAMAVRGALLKARDPVESYKKAPRIEVDGTVYAMHTGPWNGWQQQAVTDDAFLTAWMEGAELDETTAALLMDAHENCDFWVYGSTDEDGEPIPAPTLDPLRILIVFWCDRPTAIAAVSG